MNPNQSETKFWMIRIAPDTDIAMNRNSTDWLGINSYPILSPGYSVQATFYEVFDILLKNRIQMQTKYRIESFVINLRNLFMISTQGHGLTRNYLIYLLSKSESVKFLLIESVICLFTDSPVIKYISLLNQLIITEEISGIWLKQSVEFDWFTVTSF